MPSTPGPTLLRPLAHRDFRLLWLGTFVSHAGDWMDTVALAVTRLQEAADDAMRGRVMSLFFLNRGLVPAGTLLGSAGAAWLGAPAALALMGRR